MNSKHLYFLRHCCTDNNIKGLISGCLDVHIFADSLVDSTEINEIDNLIIVSSPLIRCKETVSLLQEKLQAEIPVIFDDNLKERSMGLLEGLQRDVAANKYPNLFKNDRFKYNLTPPQGETFDVFQSRANKFALDFLPTLLEKNDVLICSHNQIMKLLYIKLKNLNVHELWNKTHFKNGKVYKIN